MGASHGDNALFARAGFTDAVQVAAQADAVTLVDLAALAAGLQTCYSPEMYEIWPQTALLCEAEVCACHPETPHPAGRYWGTKKLVRVMLRAAEASRCVLAGDASPSLSMT
jgi:hypothetical protein